MSVRTLSGLMLVLLFSITCAPTTRSQGKHDSIKSVVSTREVAGQHQVSQPEPPREGEEWFARGYQMHHSDRYPEAIEAFKRSIDLGHRKATAMYNIGCGYSLMNDKENALVWLQRALDNGFDNTELVADDSDLDPLRSDARFKKIVAGMPEIRDRGQYKKAKSSVKLDRLERANFDFTRLERENSQEGEEWARAGSRLLMLRDLDRSVVALKQAVTLLDDKASSAMYNLACAYSLKGDRDSGIQWLEKSVNAGFDSPQKLRNDPDIINLRSDSRFARIDKLSNTLSLSQFDEKHDGFTNSNRDSNRNHNYSKERWAPAIGLYESFVKTEPSNGRAWANLGLALHYSSEHTRAIAAWERAIALGYHKPASTYNIACAYAMLNQKDVAFEWLDRAIAAGFDSHGELSWDKDLDNLRSDPRFRRFIESANYNSKLRHKK